MARLRTEREQEAAGTQEICIKVALKNLNEGRFPIRILKSPVILRMNLGIYCLKSLSGGNCDIEGE